MIDFGTVRPGTTLYIPFHTFDSNDPSASVTITGLATTDIEVYKNGSTTQRASDSGYALLDTDGTDFDTITGVHGFSIDLSDNTTAGFWSAGAQYWVVVSSITVDAATINFVAATFRIGYADAILDTTIATLASQVSFTLTAGPADDDALNGCPVLVHDVASAIQRAVGYVSDYTGSTKTVTLAQDPGIFTMAAGDNISVFMPANMQAIAANTTNAANVGTAGSNYSATRGLAGTALPAAAADAAGGLPISDAGGLDLDAMDSNVAAVLDDTGTSGVLLASTASSAQLVDDVLDEALAGHATAGTLGKAIADIETDAAAILVDTGTTIPGVLGTPAGADLATDIAAVDAVADAILVDTGTTIPGVLGTPAGADLATDIATVDTVVDAIKVITDALGATAAANLAKSAGSAGIVSGTAQTGTLSTTVMTSDLSEATDDHYIGRTIIWLTGALAGQSTDITDYSGTSGTLTYTAVTEAPSNGDTFIIV